jgi:hypothetical protein
MAMLFLKKYFVANYFENIPYSPFYMASLTLFPFCPTVIVLLTLATFWLPPTAGEKILLNGCTTAIICIFLLYFSQKLPAMAGHTPFVGQ